VRNDGGLNMLCDGDVLSCGCSHERMLGPYLAVYQLGHEDSHWPPSNVKVKNKQSYTSSTAVCPYDVYKETLP